MSRKMSETEVRITLAGIARIPPDDVDAYVILYVKAGDIGCIVTNTVDEASCIATLARAIEHRAQRVQGIEQQLAAQ